MQLLFGKSVADAILDRLKNDIFNLEKKPGLAVILVGGDEASKIYVALKGRMAARIGIAFSRFDFPAETDQEEILKKIHELNEDDSISGIIVQLPLPKKFNTEKIISAIQPSKDADGFSVEVGSISPVAHEMVPVFPQAIIKLLESSGQLLTGKKGVVVANSELFGKMMCAMLAQKGIISEYVLSDNISSNLSKIKESQVVVSAVGSPGLLRGEMLADGAIIIDGGIEKVGKKVVGDVDFASTEGKEGFLTPVPGGVGPVTIACLLDNIYSAYLAQQKEKKN
jgi:methylenetetrahydrofolate dehydrogenase (NADP+)/methenyltetrahydrofolate cyclohydrolase